MITVPSNYDAIAEYGSFEWQILNGSNTFTIANLMSGKLTSSIMDALSIGNTDAMQLDLELINVTVDKSSPLVLQFRAVGEDYSDWVTRGTFYIDTVQTSPYSEVTKVTAFDAMLKSEVTYSTSGGWVPTTDKAVVTDIAVEMGVEIESSTQALLNTPIALNNAPNVGPNGVTDRQMLSYIAALRGGNWRMTADNKLMLQRAYLTPSATANVGDAVETFDASPAEIVKRVKVIVDSETYYLAPAQSSEEAWLALGGRCLEVNLPFWGTQAVANDLYSKFADKAFYPYTARNAYVDPKYTCGDGITIKDVTSVIVSQTINIDALASSDMTFKGEEAIQSLYPYVSPSERNIMYVATKAQETADDAASVASAAQTSANGANYREQLIYISKASGTTSVSANTTWVTNSTGNQNVWTVKRPEYNASYPVLFVATQRQTVEQKDGTTCTCTTPMIDQTTTVIDGGHITTGTIDAGIVNVINLNASNITAGTITDATGQNSWNLATGWLESTHGKIGNLLISGNGIYYGSVDAGGDGFTLGSGGFTNTGVWGDNTISTNISNGVINFEWANPSFGDGSLQGVGSIHGTYDRDGESSQLLPNISFAVDNAVTFELFENKTWVRNALEVDGATTLDGTLTVNGTATFNSNIIVGDASTTSPRLVAVRSNSGTIYLDSVGNSNGNGSRGINLDAHGTGSAKWMVYADTNNNVFLAANTHANGVFYATALRSNDTTVNGSGIQMTFSDRDDAVYASMYAARVANYGGRIRFTQYSEDSSGNLLSGRERYSLPIPEQGIASGSNDYTIITTKNISDIPDASATVAGKVSTGNQTFAGIKTFQANALTLSVTARYPGMQFRSQNSTADRLGSLRFNFGGTTPSTVQAYIEERSLNSDGTPTNYFENYWLPVATLGRTSAGTYNIITDKDPSTSANLLGVPNIGNYGTALKAGDNVDTDLEMGKTYYSADSSTTATLSGTLPTTSSGFKIMQIRGYGASTYYFQLAFLASETPRWRCKGASSSSWTAWKSFVFDNVTKGTSGVVTRSSGATLSSQSYSKWGKVVTLDVRLNISTTTAGSVCFTGTVASGYRPASDFYGGNGSFDWSITTAGALTISVAENGNISGGAGYYHTSVTYIIA